ncbi:hypothetical protein SUNI508_08027 [Seiridium unicorne]|uniref:HTH La-type RNA-binding domain-containing protein n=1 Tax=Seiridium unicorne TaxID=138068 RepID=A0ABR2UVF0_9PEZI
MSTTFSYAQAAKGQLFTPSAPQSVTSQAASSTSNHNADAPTTADTSAASHSVGPSSISSEQDARDSIAQPAAQPESVKKTEQSTAAEAAQGDDSAPKSSATETPAVSAAERKQTSEAPAERRAKTPSARSADVPDNRKSRKGKKSRGADKESETEQATEKEKEPEAPKVQLSEAPIPSVNFWHQRAKEAQSKTVQPAPARTPATSGNAQDGKAKTPVNDNDNAGRLPTTAAKGQKKEFARDANEQASRRHAPRGSRVGEKSASESLPSVADAASWPTPESAATEVKSQETSVKSTENDEAQEEKTESGPKDKPKWVAIPFVPSAVFETPLPSRNPRGSKTGGTRGGRETGARGYAGASNPTDRTQAAGAARPSGDRSAEAGSRARASSTSVPPAKRASVDATNRDIRKVSGSNKDAAATSSTAQVNGTEESAKATASDSKEGIQGQQSTDGSSTDKRSDNRPDPSRDSFTPAAKENGTHHHAAKEKRNGRGRGGHPGASGQGHRGHGSYSVNGGQSYPGSGHMGSRQNSYPGNMSIGYGMSGAASTNGHPSRNSTSNTFYRSNNRNGRAPTMQTTPSWNMDPSMQPMPAMAHQQYLFEQNVLPLLTKQISYYFSVNNLLKDGYLRRCMDSQGYVFLDVIQNFTRIQQLTTDVNVVRMACIDSPDIELVTGMEDHRDRIRRIQGWNEFVYPPGSRNEEVNFDEGPVNVWRHDRSSMFMNPYGMVPPYQAESPGFYPPNGAPFPPYGNDGFQHYNMANGVNGVNGTNGYPSSKETQLSATVPEFSPKGGSSASDADQSGALKQTSGKEHQTNGVAPAVTNGTGDAASQPYTNGVAADADIAGH